MAKKKNSKEDESILESAEAVREQLSKTEQFLEKNRLPVIIVLVLLILGVAGVIFYREYTENRVAEAQDEIYQAIYYFEDDSLDLALEGDGNALGFYDVAEDYSGTKVGELAEFYIAAALYEKGSYEESIEYAEGVSVDDLLLQARTYAIAGDSYMQLDDPETAAEWYVKAANYKTNDFMSPLYLNKAAIAYEAAGDLQSALKAYERIVNNHYGSVEHLEARKQKARLEAALGQ